MIWVFKLKRYGISPIAKQTKPIVLLLVYCLIIPYSFAIGFISIQADHISNPNWEIQSAVLALSLAEQSKSQLYLQIEKLSFSSLNENFNLFDIECAEFEWDHSKIACHKGAAAFESAWSNSKKATLSFLIQPEASQLSLKRLNVFQGEISLSFKQRLDHWTVDLDIKRINLKSLLAQLPDALPDTFEFEQGHVDGKIRLQGSKETLKQLSINALLKQISFQGNEGSVAVDSTDLEFKIQAQQQNQSWYSQSLLNLSQGEVYLDPVYLNLHQQGLSLTFQLNTNDFEQYDLVSAELTHEDIIKLQASGQFSHQKKFSTQNISLNSQIYHLNDFIAQYLQPFMELGSLDGLDFAGTVETKIKFYADQIEQLDLKLSHLNIKDEKKRYAAEDINAMIHWRNDVDFFQTSMIDWQSLTIASIPLQRSQIKFLTKTNYLHFLEATDIPMLSGLLKINHFDFEWRKNNEPEIYFEAELDRLSLDDLSQAIGWSELSGEISGQIPGVRFQNDKLILEGELEIEVFNGLISINQLAASGWLSPLPKFYMDMDVQNLDLSALTKKIQMGHIEGRLSGYIKNLYLENWQPVSFYAWLGTPDNDDSNHHISQKAVENLASIGGGGAADIISKGFLSLFDSFGYDRIGLGCYLNEGVCQMMGVEASEQGYYIVKGGGIPRIDVVGFNPRVDWKVLLQRLSRISETDSAVVE